MLKNDTCLVGRFSDTRVNNPNQAGSHRFPKALNMAISLTFPPDRVALVTGGGRGIGEAIALTLSKGVSHVVIADMNEIAAQSVADRIVSSGGSASAVAVDVSNSAAVSDACSALVEQYGSIDVLVNNAGITRDNLVVRMSDSDWESVINVNLNSCFYFTKSLIRQMLKKRWGRVINMASVSGIGGNGGQTNYAAAKAAMIGLAKTLAKEFGGRGITSNAIAPGFIATPMTEQLTAEQKKSDQRPDTCGTYGHRPRCTLQ